MVCLSMAYKLGSIWLYWNQKFLVIMQDYFVSCNLVYLKWLVIMYVGFLFVTHLSHNKLIM